MNQFLTSELRKAVDNELPASMRTAQSAIDSDEVRAIMKQLAKYNLGVCMPHMHVNGGDFAEQPSGIVAVEDKTDFLSPKESYAQGALPVAWRWHDGEVEVTGSCFVVRRKCDG